MKPPFIHHFLLKDTMNTTIVEKRVLLESELLELGARAFEGLGLDHKDAQDVARILVTADLFGLSTHGLSRIESYGERLSVGGIKARPDIKVEQRAPAIVSIDGDNGVGPLVGMRALEAAMETARQTGVGIAFARGSQVRPPLPPDPKASTSMPSGPATIVCARPSAG